MLTSGTHSSLALACSRATGARRSAAGSVGSRRGDATRVTEERASMTAPQQDSPADAGKITRRQFVQRVAVAGAAAAAASAAFSTAALAASAAAPRVALKAQSRPLTPTFYSWITNLHPDIPTINAEFSATTPLNFQIAPVQGFGIDRFVAEAKDKTSTWDVYVGMTPFVEMTALIQADVIEPWDDYVDTSFMDDLIPSIKNERTVDGQR